MTTRQIRKECLDVFYRNRFFLDLRGWKSATYPQYWTPEIIFQQWITAIGDENASRLRNLSFMSHNFSIGIKISNEKTPSLALRFRTSANRPECAEGVPSKYSFKTAAQHAEKALRTSLDQIESSRRDQIGLSVADFTKICTAVHIIQPFLCTRVSLGYQDAIIPDGDVPMERWPSTATHLDMCDDCGYHRYTRSRD